jgi:beta-phosphoglucomutase-like phosphatase (HAD superfamily)
VTADSPVGVLLDVDGTLVDTNYHHTIAWSRAFRRYDVVVPLWKIHRHIGMGGDQIVSALAGEETAIALLTGGYGADELREAGASEVFESADSLRLALGKTALTA